MYRRLDRRAIKGAWCCWGRACLWATCAALKFVICFAKALAQTTLWTEQREDFRVFRAEHLSASKNVCKLFNTVFKTSHSPSVPLVLKCSGEGLFFLAPAQQLDVPGENCCISSSACRFWSVRIYLGVEGWHGVLPNRAGSSFQLSQCVRSAVTATVPFKDCCVLPVA